MPESTVRWLSDEHPTMAALVIANLRAFRATCGYVMTGDQWTLLAAYDQLEKADASKAAEIEKLKAKLATAERQLDEVVDSLGVPGEPVIA
jgi:hypothetical protein